MKQLLKHSFRASLVLAACAAVVIGISPTAFADTITYTATGTGLDVSATVTTGTNSVTITLTNLEANPTSAAQEISGVYITLGSTLTTDSISSVTGALLNSSFASTTGNAGAHWGTSVVSGDKICLESAGNCAPGGQPYDLIIGPGPYTNANPSITNHSPVIDQTATFVLTVAGVNSDTDINGLTFQFGTSEGEVTLTGTPSTPPSVPEPSSLILLGTGIVGVAGMVRRRFVKA